MSAGNRSASNRCRETSAREGLRSIVRPTVVFKVRLRPRSCLAGRNVRRANTLRLVEGVRPRLPRLRSDVLQHHNPPAFTNHHRLRRAKFCLYLYVTFSMAGNRGNKPVVRETTAHRTSKTD